MSCLGEAFVWFIKQTNNPFVGLFFVKQPALQLQGCVFCSQWIWCHLLPDGHDTCMFRLNVTFTTYRLGFGSRIGHGDGRWQVSALSVGRQVFWCLNYWNSICSTFRSWFQILWTWNAVIWKACECSFPLFLTSPFTLPFPVTANVYWQTDVDMSLKVRGITMQEVAPHFGNWTR